VCYIGRVNVLRDGVSPRAVIRVASAYVVLEAVETQ